MLRRHHPTVRNPSQGNADAAKCCVLPDDGPVHVAGAAVTGAPDTAAKAYRIYAHHGGDDVEWSEVWERARHSVHRAQEIGIEVSCHLVWVFSNSPPVMFRLGDAETLAAKALALTGWRLARNIGGSL